ncbi:MAG: hypothetical protein ABIJ09_23725 [Pseudomonadota bacterium]
MPNDLHALRSTLQRALSNKVLSQSEADKIVREVRKDGVTDAEVGEVVSTLRQAMGDGLDVSTDTRRRSIESLLGHLDAERAVMTPSERNELKRPDGTTNYLGLLMKNRQREAVDLPAKGFGGQTVGVDDLSGRPTLGGQEVSLDSGTPDRKAVDALMALNKPGQLDGLDAAVKTKLGDALLDGVAKNTPVPLEGAGKHARSVATCASVGALDGMKGSLNSAQVDRLLEQYASLPTPMAQSLAHRALDGATKTDAQKQRFEALAKPEKKDELVAAWDEARSERSRAGYQTVKGGASQFELSALTYANDKAAIDNVHEGMKVFKDLNSDYSKPWDAEELGHLDKTLETYIEKYPQASFAYGSFASDAPKALATISNARTVERLSPQLDAASPSFDGVPLSRTQADYVKTLLPGIKDDDAVKDVSRALGEAGTLFSTRDRGWGDAPKPTEPLSPAAFEQFKRVADRAFDTRGDTKDGMLDAMGVKNDLAQRVKDIKQDLTPRLRELGGQPPTWDGVQLSDVAASEVKDLLRNNLRSEMSVGNLGEAIKTVAAANGGKIEGQGFGQFKSIVDGYKANWPGETFFDFNKLGRIASFKVQGKDVPLCKLNGEPVGLAQFNDKVATSVAASIDKNALKQPWMADRWGARAKQSVELLDVIAQQTAENKGPVHALKQQFPGKDIQVLATGMDGAHSQFVFELSDRGRRVGRFTQGSDGVVKPYTGGVDPQLFTASVRDDGAFDVKIPTRNTVRNYPLQTTYSVGDSVDWSVLDSAATELQDEGKPFSTKYKIVEASIQGFDAKGNYTIAYRAPDGSDKTETVPLSRIRGLNNPHQFSTSGSTYSDVSINVNSDAELKKFLDEAQPLIDKHFPPGQSRATLSTAEMTKRQKACIKDLMAYTTEKIKYPADKDHNPDDASKRYHELDTQYRFPLGELAKIGKGVCRHQCIFEHLLLQRAGIDSRLASGAANTSSGDFRGYHIWTEVSLADNARYMSDQTWDDPTIPLWKGAYDSDKRRIEMYDRTARYDSNLAQD